MLVKSLIKVPPPPFSSMVKLALFACKYACVCVRGVFMVDVCAPCFVFLWCVYVYTLRVLLMWCACVCVYLCFMYFVCEVGMCVVGYAP